MTSEPLALACYRVWSMAMVHILSLAVAAAVTQVAYTFTHGSQRAACLFIVIIIIMPICVLREAIGAVLISNTKK